MAKRKLESDFLKNPGDFLMKEPGKSNNVQNIIQDLDETSYENFESIDPDQELSMDLLEELSPLIRLNDRKQLNSDEKPKKPKVVAEQCVSNRFTILKPSKNDSLTKSPGASFKNSKNNQVCFKPVSDEKIVNETVTRNYQKTPGKSVSKAEPVNNNKLPKLKLNLSDGNTSNFNGSTNTIKTSPGIVLQLRALDPTLRNDLNLKEKVRKLKEQTGEPKNIDNLVDSNDSVNHRVGNFKTINKPGDKPANSSTKELVNYNNCNRSNNSSRNSSSSRASHSNNVNKKTVEISENLVSTTTESTQSNECNRTTIVADVFWGLMGKMKERNREIEVQCKKPPVDMPKEFKNKQPTVDELLLRLIDKDKLIHQLQEANKDLTEKLRKEKLAGHQLRINLMRYQKQAMDLKNEVTLKTELIDEIYEASVKVRKYFESGSVWDHEDNNSRT